MDKIKKLKIKIKCIKEFIKYTKIDPSEKQGAKEYLNLLEKKLKKEKAKAKAKEKNKKDNSGGTPAPSYYIPCGAN